MEALFYLEGTPHAPPSFPEPPPKRPQRMHSRMFVQVGPYYRAQERMARAAGRSHSGIFCTECKDFVDFGRPRKDGSPFICCWCEVKI